MMLYLRLLAGFTSFISNRDRVPSRLDRTGRNSGVECHTMSGPGRNPARMAIGTEIKPTTMTTRE